ncbi:hypothetical protein [Nostoc sp.]|uniref:hypothetical protein n=1 Tax=Nostoc sp. TaxID=1180 RepID=UPI002FF66C9B
MERQSVSAKVSEQSASFLTNEVINYLQKRLTVQQFVGRCESLLKRPVTVEEFLAIAELTASYGYEVDVDAVCSEIERKKQISLLRSDLKMLFTETTPLTVHSTAKNKANSVLQIVLTSYVKDELPAIAASHRCNKYVSPESKRIDVEISQKDLIERLEHRLGFSISRRDMDEITVLMSNFGYTYQRVGDAMGFVKG